MIPAFVFFFQMLYPFAWVNRPARRIAAAAGGCMLARREALLAAGGIECDPRRADRRLRARPPAEGARARSGSALTERVRSLRPYAGLGEIRRMVARSAYAQLRFSPLLLAGTALGMVVTYLVPPLLVFFGSALAAGAGGLGRHGAGLPA